VNTVNATKTVAMTEEVYPYLLSQAPSPTPVQRWLVERTLELGEAAEMQIPHEQAAFLTLLTQLVAARRIVEVGTFTGYSTLAFALGLPADGVVITCDVSPEWTGIALEAWRMAGVRDQVDLRLGPAAETLAGLDEPVDLVFLDADKTGYLGYWEQLVPLVRPGGLLLADNVLYYGEAAAPDATGNARAIREFNERVRTDQRVESVMLPIADGLTIARRRLPGPRT
jgi:caffeoyl-CoA O-methyltransferase